MSKIIFKNIPLSSCIVAFSATVITMLLLSWKSNASFKDNWDILSGIGALIPDNKGQNGLSTGDMLSFAASISLFTIPILLAYIGKYKGENIYQFVDIMKNRIIEKNIERKDLSSALVHFTKNFKKNNDENEISSNSVYNKFNVIINFLKINPKNKEIVPNITNIVSISNDKIINNSYVDYFITFHDVVFCEKTIKSFFVICILIYLNTYLRYLKVQDTQLIIYAELLLINFVVAFNFMSYICLYSNFLARINARSDLIFEIYNAIDQIEEPMSRYAEYKRNSSNEDYSTSSS